MPFILPQRRKIIQKKGLDGLDPVQPGDRCYVFYKEMVDRWKKSPSWTTVHEIYEEIVYYQTGGNRVAKELAWQVFFQLHVIPYEKKKRKEHGDIG